LGPDLADIYIIRGDILFHLSISCTLIGFHSIFLTNHQFNTNGPISGSVFFHSESFTTPVFETQNHAGYDTR